MSIEPDKFRTLLIESRKELEEASDLASESRDAVELDQQSVGRVSRIDAMQRQAMANAGQQRRIVLINRIIAALQRIEMDEYGYCLKCGEEIAHKRLQLDPAAPLCVSCAQ